MSLEADEAPLLGSHSKAAPTPLPWPQLSIFLSLHLADQLTSQAIYPFVPQLIRDIGITNGNESQVGYYVGLLHSLSYLTQAVTVLYWSRASDHVGRKPIMLLGLFGLSASMYFLGLSRTFWSLVLSRSLNGILNGNVGVEKSILAEITDSSNMARAYAYVPIAWSTGSTLGPLIGGSLSQPAERFPNLFGGNEFLIKYPYFLPCAVPATVTAIVWLVTFLYLKETVKSPVPLSHLFKLLKTKSMMGSRNVGSSYELSPTSVARPYSMDEKPLPLRLLLTRQVIIAAVNYACLSLVEIAFHAIHPLFLSTPIALGGLGLPPPTIGKILSTHGILNGLFQVLLFARIYNRWGSKKVFIVGISSAFPAFAAFPLINYLARTRGINTTVWCLVVFQTTMVIGLSVAFGAVFIFVTAASPNQASLGATNGLCQTTVSIMRSIGPAAANSLFSLSIEKNYLGGNLVYFALIATVGVSVMFASLLPIPRKSSMDEFMDSPVLQTSIDSEDDESVCLSELNIRHQ